MATRSLHACGAGAKGDYFPVPGLRAITSFTRLMPAARSAPAAHGSVAVTAGVRTGMRGAEGTASMVCAGRSAGGTSFFAGMPAPACTPVAQWRGTITSGCPAGGRRRSSGRAMKPGTSAGGHFSGTATRKPARPRRGCAGRYFRLARFGCDDALRAARCRPPVPPPPAFRRRDRVDGYTPRGGRPHPRSAPASGGAPFYEHAVIQQRRRAPTSPSAPGGGLPVRRRLPACPHAQKGRSPVTG